MSSFDIRLRLYSAAGVRGRVLRTQTLTLNGVFGGISTVTATVSEKVFGSVPDWTVVALEYSDGLVWVEPDDARFILSRDQADAADVAGVKTLTGTAFIPWLLQRNRMQYQMTLVNGQRPWKGTAGLIATTSLTEGHSRGWGPLVTSDFDATHDSAGVAWDATPIEQAFNVGVSAWDMYQWLVSSGNADFTTTGNVIHLWRPGYGTDRASISSPVRITQKATSAPITRSVDEVMTAITAQGDGNVWASADIASDLGLGRLEGWVQAAGATTSAAVASAAKAAVAAAGVAKREVSVTYSSTNGGPLPFIDFVMGDVIQGRYQGGWTALRVVELVLRRNSDGVVEVTTVLGDRFKSPLGNLAERPSPGVSGAVTPTGGSAPIPADLRVPKAPEGVSLTATGHWSASGLPVASLAVSWLAVTDATTDEPLTVDQYEIWSRLVTDTDAHRVTATGSLSVLLDDLTPADTVVITVRARSAGGVWSEFSTEATQLLPSPTDVLDPPTVPIVTSKLGQVSVRFDGLLQPTVGSPVAPPAQFRYAYTIMSDSEAGTYAPVGQNLGHAGASTISGLALGDVRWFKFIAVDSRGVASAPSAAVSVTVVGVTGPDLEANSVTANAVEAGVGIFEKLSLGAVGTRGMTTERVPSPLTDSAFWGKALDGTLPLVPLAPTGFTQQNAAAGSTGITLTPTATDDALMYLSELLPVPPSNAITCSVVPDVPVVRTNLLSNPSGRRTLTGYSAVGGSMGQEPGQDTYLIASADAAAGAAYIIVQNLTVGVDIPANTTLSITGLLYASGSSAGIFINGTGVVASASSPAVSVSTFTSSATTFVTAASGVVTVYVYNATAIVTGNLIAFRDMILEAAAVNGAYFDGNTPAAGDNTYAWAGTADASISTETSRRGVRVLSRDAAWTVTQSDVPSGTAWQFPAGAVEYTTYIDQPANSASRLVQQAHVFEVIGTDPGQQHAELSPSGLRLVSDDGSTSVDLTTNSDQVLSVQKFTGLGFESVATINSNGAGFFKDLAVDNDITVAGAQVVGGFASRLVNGGAMTMPLLDRPGGVIVGIGDFGRLKGSSPDNRITTSATAQALAAGRMTFEAGRRYAFDISGQLTSYWNAAPGANVLRLEIWVGDSQQDVGAPNGTQVGSWNLLPSSSPVGSRESFTAGRTSPQPGLSGVKYFIVRLTTTTSVSYTVVDGWDTGDNPKLIVTDAGPDADYANLGTVASRVNSGVPVVPPSPTLYAWSASWSRSWNNNGASIISGSGQYTDANSLYQGMGGSPDGSRFGIPPAVASILSGKSILSCQIFLQNRHFASYSGGIARLGTGGNSSAPATFGTRQNGWDVPWGRGEGKKIDVPSSLWDAIKSGAIRDFSLGVSNSVSDYAYFDGYLKSAPPSIWITAR